MDVIEVPAPPKEAFNKHRRISDLIKAQIKHLKHLEEKLPANVKAKLPQHAVVTENDAAIYIAAMTRLLRGQAVAVEDAPKRKKKVVEIRPAAGLDLAAAAGNKPGAGGKDKKRAKAPKKVAGESKKGSGNEGPIGRGKR